ncbi:conserved hypothetical protein [Sporisorium reilianum SRZ2]|uniref:Uncharacterized protein n=1 Tax=Sporisorium reilianum (strain SRZ2) TaxID=999809 RepID=E6ZT62_SPORE|nr:conserved hypothetical protein [Sporisorium reilianum SRZ2]
MPCSDQVAVQASGHLDLRHGHPLDRSGASDAVKTPSPFLDITPEVLRRFLSYESSLAPDHVAPSSPYHDASSALPSLPSNQVLRGSSMDATYQAPGTVRRSIRALPNKKKPVDRSDASLAAKTAAWNHSPAKLPDTIVAGGDLLPLANQTDASPRRPSESFSSKAPSGSLNSQPLAQYFEQLRVSAQQHHQGSAHTPIASDSKQQQKQRNAAGSTEQHVPVSHSSFRFSSLPPSLTDNGFHNRQRAAQFILLYSRWATREQLARCNRFSLSFDLSLPHHSKSRDGTNRVTARPGADRQAAEDSSFSVLDDNESLHSHHHTHGASDNESEYLDFDACRTAHLSNKKKRKSTRHSGPALASTSNVMQGVQSMDDSAQASSQGTQNRALVDKTNTAHQPARQLSVRPVYKHEDAAPPTAPSTSRDHSYVRLPPRQTSSERHKVAIRHRLRARLAPIFQRRMLERVKELDQIKQQHQQIQDAHDSRVKAEADTALEKRAPAKRTSKAGKRAQAIRGGASPVRPLTIAEIRARAAGASTGSSGASSTTGAKTSPSPPPPKDPARTSPRPPVEKSDSTPVSSTLANTAPSRSGLSAPTSTFDFRMSSDVTFRLRELRSQLDAATRNLGVSQADSRAVASTSQPARPSPPDDRENGVKSTMTSQGNGHPDHMPPWARRAVDYQKRAAEHDMIQEVITAKPPQPHQPVKDDKTSSLAVASQARTGTLTTNQQAKQPSPPARPKTTPASPSPGTTKKATNGRRTSARRPDASSHKHDSACKHGPAHGHSRTHGTGSALFTPDDWVCLFCEYELYYGEKPLMLRACRNRKKQVEKKSNVKSKAKAVLQKKPAAKLDGSGCQHDHDHHHDHDHDHDTEYRCIVHDHHDHSSVSGSECCDHDHGDDHPHSHDHHGHDHGKGGSGSHRARPQPRARRAPEAYVAHRNICDCGNSIHSSESGDEHK